MDIHQKLTDLLNSKNISFESFDHDPATTCEEAAQNRGRDLAIGGKTLLLKSKKGYAIFVLSAAKKADSSRIRKILRSQKLRFASEEEFKEIGSVSKGALPPFGEGIYPYELYVDLSVLQNDYIAFNAGILTRSYILKMDDYLSVVSPFYCHFSKSPT